MIAHVFFERTGVFKNALEENGICAYDYDIENSQFVDYNVDLFDEIEKKHYNKKGSIFDKITKDDIIIAFFPCVYFCQYNMIEFTGKAKNHKTYQNIEEIRKRAYNRYYYYDKLLKLIGICVRENIKLIIENPATDSYLKNNLPYDALLIDKNRRLNGDKFKKPTYFFFYNFEPCLYDEVLNLENYTINEKETIYKKKGFARSVIDIKYAMNFVKKVLRNG